MADKKEKKKNIFQRIRQSFKDVVLELKRVIWPSKEKLKNISAVVLVCIVFFAIFLSIINLGGHWLLEKIHFYDQVEATTVVTTAATEATTTTVETTVEETSEEASNG